jgi:hypothetical protein
LFVFLSFNLASSFNYNSSLNQAHSWDELSPLVLMVKKNANSVIIASKMLVSSRDYFISILAGFVLSSFKTHCASSFIKKYFQWTESSSQSTTENVRYQCHIYLTVNAAYRETIQQIGGTRSYNGTNMAIKIMLAISWSKKHVVLLLGFVVVVVVRL